MTLENIPAPPPSGSRTASTSWSRMSGARRSRSRRACRPPTCPTTGSTPRSTSSATTATASSGWALSTYLWLPNYFLLKFIRYRYQPWSACPVGGGTTRSRPVKTLSALTTSPAWRPPCGPTSRSAVELPVYSVVNDTSGFLQVHVQSFAAGGRAYFSCQRGHTMNDSEQRASREAKCLSKGEWSVELLDVNAAKDILPRCDPIVCPR